MNRIDSLVDESLRHMREVLPTYFFADDYPLIVNFSGGKDSTACLLLARMLTDHVQTLFMDSGQDLPMTLDYVKQRAREMDVKLIITHPGVNKVNHRTIPDNVHLFHEYIEHYRYFPTSGCRWCSIWLKQRPAKVALRERFGNARIFKMVGVKQADSTRRASVYGEAGAKKFGGYWCRPDHEMPGTMLAYPILKWTKEDCYNFIKREGVDIHDGYKLFGVSGCAWCPVHEPETCRRIHEVYPHIYDDLIRAEDIIDKPAWTHKKVWLRDVVSEDEKIAEAACLQGRKKKKHETN